MNRTLQGFKNFCSGVLDVLFPSLCVICKERFEKKPFCAACWDLCSLIDPLGRCPHCFEESEGLCRRCLKNPWLVFTKAFVFESVTSALYLERHRDDLMASFLICQWAKLSWPVPDIVVSMPHMEKIAFDFAEKIERPCISLFKSSWIFDAEKIDEGLVILLLDRGSPFENQREAARSLCSSFPKKGYLLSLFSHDTFDF